MINFIEQLISDTHHGSTVLFRQTLEYFLGLSDDQLQNQIKLSCQRLANYFQFMGLFQSYPIPKAIVEEWEKVK